MNPFRSSPGIGTTTPRLTRVRDVLVRSALMQRRQIAEVMVGVHAEPVFDIGGGFFVASKSGLDKYRSLNREWFNYDAHHIIEYQHLQLFPQLHQAWEYDTMPCVLLPKTVHSAVAGDLKQAVGAGVVGMVTKREMLAGYIAVYQHLSSGHLLVPIVRSMLRL